MISQLKYPSAWAPIVMSLIVLSAMLVLIGVSGPPVREPDEGVGAHVFQIWLVVEAFMIVFFATKWLPRRPVQALGVLALQVVAVLAVCTPVFYFNL